MDNLLRRHAEVYLSSLLALAILDVGDFRDATHLARRAVVRLLEELPETTRENQIQLLGIEVRTYQGWVAEVLKEEEERRQQMKARGEEPPVASSKVRFFIQVMSLFLEAGEEYLSVGQITDRLNEGRSRFRLLPYGKVQERLDLLVGLGQLEHHPESPMKYRATVRNPRLLTEELSSREELLKTIVPSIYRTSYQIFTGADGAGARINYYAVPESRVRDFAEAVKREHASYSERLMKLETQYQRENPAEIRFAIADINMFGRDPLAKVPEEESP